MPLFDDKTGRRYGRLVAIRPYDNPSGRWRWLCQCDCGNYHILPTHSLTKGNTKSCGCLHRETCGALKGTHRQSRTPAYRSWVNARNRCRNPKNHAWKDYGGRGITFSEKYDRFEDFFADMGERPSGTSLDRIDNDRGYEPGNVRWATKQEQANNTRPRPKCGPYRSRVTF